MTDIACLLLHHVHHAPHLLPIARALAAEPGDVRVTVYSSSALNDELYRRVELSKAGVRLVPVLRERPLPPGYNYPEPRAALSAIAEGLGRADAIITSSFEDLELKRILGDACPPMVMAFHGAGDGAYGFSSRLVCFDLLLLAGKKVAQRLEKSGLLDGVEWAVTGYPKFEMPTAGAPVHFAGNTALYNPHWNPDLSSWPGFGTAVLQWFARHREWQLIFAPHVLLTGPRRPLDLSPFVSCPNIHVDLGSTASVDMSYLREADVYIGDVSSQVYEFLRQPRPCLFLNPGVGGWERDPDYLHWQCGTVWQDANAIGGGLRTAIDRHADCLPRQEELFQQTFDLAGGHSSVRAADAITAFLRERRG